MNSCIAYDTKEWGFKLQGGRLKKGSVENSVLRTVHFCG